MFDPDNWVIVDCAVEQQPLLTVVVDTEAEFDWRTNATRRATSVKSVARQQLAHRIFEKYRVRPTYVLDFPVSSNVEGFGPIRELLASGQCEIGAHLQPWDTPPFEEMLSDATSYPGNLPPRLEQAKLAELTTTIVRNLGVQPRIYKAGRYGVGAATPEMLSDLGYLVDVSVLPGTDLSPQLGPDFTRCGVRPYWFGERDTLLEIPMTIGFTGGLSHFGVSLHKRLNAPFFRSVHMPGIFARLHLLDRVTLTPEGVTLVEQRRLTKALLNAGVRIFSFTYHSPSLAPGNTPYVRTESDLREFLHRIESFLDFFTSEIGGRAATPLEIRDMILAQTRHGAKTPPA